MAWSTTTPTARRKRPDCAIIIAAAERTTTSEVDNVEKEIAEHTNVLGTVLNAYTNANAMTE